LIRPNSNQTHPPRSFHIGQDLDRTQQRVYSTKYTLFELILGGRQVVRVIKLLFFVTLFSITILPFFSTQAQEQLQFPVAPELFVGGEFGGSEGIAFNGEGRLFVTASRLFDPKTTPIEERIRALWEVSTAGEVRHIADVFTTLGIAGVGKRDLLVADFGPTSAFKDDRNTDGIVWRISPDGDKEKWVTGIGDPNFILVRKDGSLLVSDDATSDIYVIGADRQPKIFSTAVNHPNGLVLSDDENTLYVAQIFKSIRPVIGDDSVWSIDLKDGKPIGGAELVARTGPLASNDGLAMDEKGRIYIAGNGKAGEIWRFDPVTKELVLIAKNVYGAASIAFGEGKFDHKSIYVSTTFSGGRGGNTWRVPVGVKGAALNR
jgi:sugar lactone lactonase YvrE